jgi:hypothetical protein
MFIDRVVLAAGRILDRAADQPRCRRLPDGFRRFPGRIAETVLEIGADRQVGGADDLARVLHRLLPRDRAVRPPAREGETGARRRQRRETEMGEQTGRPDIPRVGNDEGAGLVQGAEGSGLFVLAWHRRLP